VISLRQVGVVDSVNVDFSEYVPLTITWSSASQVLEPPRYVELWGENAYLELKFHPDSGILIEVVLVAAAEIKVEQRNLSPGNSKDTNLMPFLDSGGTIGETGGLPVVKAYPDYLCVSFGPDPDHWVGSDPVLFGLTAEQSLTAICARWTSSERESVLAGHLCEDRSRCWDRRCYPRYERPPQWPKESDRHGNLRATTRKPYVTLSTSTLALHSRARRQDASCDHYRHLQRPQRASEQIS
jgi:hypothetical protein